MLLVRLCCRGPGAGQQSVIEIETQYMELCMQKTNLESELARLGRSVRFVPQRAHNPHARFSPLDVRCVLILSVTLDPFG